MDIIGRRFMLITKVFSITPLVFQDKNGDTSMKFQGRGVEIPLKGFPGEWKKLGNAVAVAGVQQKNFRHQSSRTKHLGRSNPTL